MRWYELRELLLTYINECTSMKGTCYCPVDISVTDLVLWVIVW